MDGRGGGHRDGLPPPFSPPGSGSSGRGKVESGSSGVDESALRGTSGTPTDRQELFVRTTTTNDNGSSQEDSRRRRRRQNQQQFNNNVTPRRCNSTSCRPRQSGMPSYSSTQSPASLNQSLIMEPSSRRSGGMSNSSYTRSAKLNQLLLVDPLSNSSASSSTTTRNNNRLLLNEQATELNQLLMMDPSSSSSLSPSNSMSSSSLVPNNLQNFGTSFLDDDTAKDAGSLFTAQPGDHTTADSTTILQDPHVQAARIILAPQQQPHKFDSSNCSATPPTTSHRTPTSSNFSQAQVDDHGMSQRSNAHSSNGADTPFKQVVYAAGGTPLVSQAYPGMKKAGFEGVKGVKVLSKMKGMEVHEIFPETTNMMLAVSMVQEAKEWIDNFQVHVERPQPQPPQRSINTESPRNLPIDINVSATTTNSEEEATLGPPNTTTTIGATVAMAPTLAASNPEDSDAAAVTGATTSPSTTKQYDRVVESTTQGKGSRNHPPAVGEVIKKTATLEFPLHKYRSYRPSLVRPISLQRARHFAPLLEEGASQNNDDLPPSLLELASSFSSSPSLQPPRIDRGEASMAATSGVRTNSSTTSSSSKSTTNQSIAALGTSGGRSGTSSTSESSDTATSRSNGDDSNDSDDEDEESVTSHNTTETADLALYQEVFSDLHISSSPTTNDISGSGSNPQKEDKATTTSIGSSQQTTSNIETMSTSSNVATITSSTSGHEEDGESQSRRERDTNENIPSSSSKRSPADNAATIESAAAATSKTTHFGEHQPDTTRGSMATESSETSSKEAQVSRNCQGKDNSSSADVTAEKDDKTTNATDSSQGIDSLPTTRPKPSPTRGFIFGSPKPAQKEGFIFGSPKPAPKRGFIFGSDAKKDDVTTNATGSIIGSGGTGGSSAGGGDMDEGPSDTPSSATDEATAPAADQDYDTLAALQNVAFYVPDGRASTTTDRLDDDEYKPLRDDFVTDDEESVVDFYQVKLGFVEKGEGYVADDNDSLEEFDHVGSWDIDDRCPWCDYPHDDDDDDGTLGEQDREEDQEEEQEEEEELLVTAAFSMVSSPELTAAESANKSDSDDSSTSPSNAWSAPNSAQTIWPWNLNWVDELEKKENQAVL